jgi:hypothetical protein
MLDHALPAAAQNYPLLNLFWTMLWFFVWVLWLFLVVRVAIDIFRSRDLSGWGKAGWLAFVVVVPFIGIFTYLIARGGKMGLREGTDAQAAHDRTVSDPWQQLGAPPGTADELAKLATLHDKGVLSDQEFAAQKATLLR